MTNHVQYTRRLPPANTACLRVRLEESLTKQLQATQERPELLIKETRIPSSSLIVRRALATYFDALRQMKPEQLKRKRLTTTVVDGGENRHQSGAHHFRFDGHHCDRVGSQAG